MDDIDRQIEDLKEQLLLLRERMPETPLDAERKAMDVGLLEEQLAELYEAKKAESSATCESRPLPDEDELTQQIASITDALMQLEVRMIKAEMAGDESERIKLQLSASVLKDRRQTLIEQVKEMNGRRKQHSNSDLEARVAALEEEVEYLKALLYRILKE